MSESDTRTLHELMQTLNAGTEFYRNAIDTAQYPQHKLIFQRMLTSRTAVEAYLQAYLNLTDDTQGLVHAFGSFLHKIYPEILSGLDRTRDTILIDHIGRIEQETLAAMQKALNQVESPLLRSVILDLHPKLTSGHKNVQPLDKAC